MIELTVATLSQVERLSERFGLVFVGKRTVVSTQTLVGLWAGLLEELKQDESLVYCNGAVSFGRVDL